MMTPPVAMAANAWTTRLLIESTSDTPESAAAPTLLTIMESAIPIREFRNCSAIIGISNRRSFLLLKMCLSFILHSFGCVKT